MSRRSPTISARFRAQHGVPRDSRCCGRRGGLAGCRAGCSTPATTISALIEPAARKGIEFRRVPAPICRSTHRRLSPCWLSSGRGVGCTADRCLASGHRPVRLLVVRTTNGVALRACRLASSGDTVSSGFWPPACRDFAGITACHGSTGRVAAARQLQCSRRRQPPAIGGSRPSACAAGRSPERRPWAGRACSYRRARVVTVTDAGRGTASVVVAAVPTVPRRVPATGAAATLGNRCPRAVAVTAGCVVAAARSCRTSGYRPAPPVTVTTVEPCTANTYPSAAATVHRSAPAMVATRTLLHRRPRPADIRGLSCDLAAAVDISRAPGCRRISPVAVTYGALTCPSGSVTAHPPQHPAGRPSNPGLSASPTADRHCPPSADTAGRSKPTSAYRHSPPVTITSLGHQVPAGLRSLTGTRTDPNQQLSAFPTRHRLDRGAHCRRGTSGYRRARPLTRRALTRPWATSGYRRRCPFTHRPHEPPGKHLAIGGPRCSPTFPSITPAELCGSNSHLSAFLAGHTHAQ